jgi:two-component system invasion response regulator UvrY
MMSVIRVLIADDHPLVRSGLRQILAPEPDFAIPGEAADSEEAVKSVDEHNWDVVLLDISMPGRDGLDALREIRRRRPALPILVLSMHSEDHFAIRAIKAGANGYITKLVPPGELIQAIRRVSTGKKYVTPAVAEALANAVESGNRSLHENLSDREFQTVRKIAAGKTVSEIAMEISLSVKTVSTYRARALEKMGMHTNAELTRYAIENSLVD